MKSANKEKIINSSKKEVQIKFISDLTEEYQLKSQNILTLPLEVGPKKLNELLHKLLKTDKNFSFFINSIQLNESLSDFITKNLLSTESVIEIYYMLEINEPQHTNTIKEDEWIKSIQILKQMKYKPNSKQIYAVGLFNGEISFYSNEDKKLFSLKSPEDNIKDDNAMSLLTDLKYFKKEENVFMIRTLKNDENILELYDIDENKQKVNLIYQNEQNNSEFYNTIDIDPFNFELIALGGEDSESKGVLDLFKLPEDLNLNSKNSTKKRKIDKHSLIPIHTFKELHNTQVEHICFLNEDKIITSGDDFNLNLFNLSSNSLFLNYNTNFKRATCIQPFNSEIFLVGYQDGIIKMYDSRIGNKSVKQFKDKDSSMFISDICFNSDREIQSNLLVSTGYDGGAKFWDIRAGTEPLKRIEGTKDEKNYSIKFNGKNTIMFGGNNSSVNIYSI